MTEKTPKELIEEFRIFDDGIAECTFEDGKYPNSSLIELSKLVTKIIAKLLQEQVDCANSQTEVERLKSSYSDQYKKVSDLQLELSTSIPIKLYEELQDERSLAVDVLEAVKSDVYNYGEIKQPTINKCDEALKQIEKRSRFELLKAQNKFYHVYLRKSLLKLDFKSLEHIAVRGCGMLPEINPARKLVEDTYKFRK